MWNSLPKTDKERYKRLILAFASLTEMFAQKEVSSSKEVLAPIINSKFQETAFQRSFHARAEDIGNTAYDVSLNLDGTIFLIGIKTFGIDSGYQKIAQFKANRTQWSSIINEMTNNATSTKKLTSEEITELNKELYKDLAIKIATIRNQRIDSAEAQAVGPKNFSKPIKRVYHVLMPSKKNSSPTIYVGETSYSKINLSNIHDCRCSRSVSSNFDFSDGIHEYRFTAADNQLLMNFDNKHIIVDQWDVIYAENAIDIFEKIASDIYGSKTETISISWLISKNGVVPRYSGFNAFFGLGSKLPADKRKKAITDLTNAYKNKIEDKILTAVIQNLEIFLCNSEAKSEPKVNPEEKKKQKELLRNEILELTMKANNTEFLNSVNKLVFRPDNELYIPFPNSKQFHEKYPDFFKKGLGETLGKKIDKTKKENRTFTIVLQPSNTSIDCIFTQENGKGIESVKDQSVLGKWIRKGVFQLEDNEPLTSTKLDELGINGIRMEKVKEGVFNLYFVWIDPDNLPDDYIEKILNENNSLE